MVNENYVAIGSSLPDIIFTEEEENWLREHPLLPEERQLERIQRMLSDLTTEENKNE